MIAGLPPACPKCESEETIPIAYGEPTEETVQAAMRGEVALGGCVIMGDDPNRHCKDCGHRWLTAGNRTRSGRRPGRSARAKKR